MIFDEHGVWITRGNGGEREEMRVGLTWTAEVVRVPNEREPGACWWEARVNGRALGQYSNKDHAKAHVDWTIAYEVWHMHDGYVRIAARKECWEGIRGGKPMRPYVR